MRTASSSSIAFAARLAPRRAAVDEQRFRDLIADREHRVERGHRLLEDQRDLGAAHRAHRPSRRASSRSRPLNRMRPAGDAAGRLHQPHDRQRGHRLAAARFADQPERLAGANLEADVVDGRRPAPRRRDRRRSSGVDTRQQRFIRRRGLFDTRRTRRASRRRSRRRSPGLHGRDDRRHQVAAVARRLRRPRRALRCHAVALAAGAHRARRARSAAARRRDRRRRASVPTRRRAPARYRRTG